MEKWEKLLDALEDMIVDMDMGGDDLRKEGMLASYSIDSIPDVWGRWPSCYLGYGLRDGCVRDTVPFWDDEDVNTGITRMFRRLCRSVMEVVLEEKRYEEAGEYFLIDREENKVRSANCGGGVEVGVKE